jgi:hypothetical protein
VAKSPYASRTCANALADEKTPTNLLSVLHGAITNAPLNMALCDLCIVPWQLDMQRQWRQDSGAATSLSSRPPPREGCASPSTRNESLITMISNILHISAHPRALSRSWVNTRAVHRVRRCASAAGTGPGPVSDATVPEGHKSLHSFLYGNDADTAHAAAEYTPVQGEDDGAALLPVPEYLAGRRARGGAAVPGAYAVHDVSGTLQYVGFSRDVCKALQVRSSDGHGVPETGCSSSSSSAPGTTGHHQW